MKRISFALVFLLSACSFAPISISVPDFFIKAANSADQVCYARINESTRVGFNSVVYEGDALYTEDEAGVGGDGTITMRVYGREDIPGTDEGDVATCVTRSAADIALSEAILLTSGETKRISAGGSELAKLVVKDSYWLGAAVEDSSVIRLPGDIDFTNGKVEANF